MAEESPEEGECMSRDSPGRINSVKTGEKRRRDSKSSEEGECSSSAEEEVQPLTSKKKHKVTRNLARRSQKRKEKKESKAKTNTAYHLMEQTVSYTMEENNLNETYNLPSLLKSPTQYQHLVSNLITNNNMTQKGEFSVRDLQNILIQLLIRRVGRDVTEVNRHSISSVVVIWMAHVSAELVKEHWPAFQVTFPTESSKLLYFMNPGTNRYVRPGYEEMLLIQDTFSSVKRSNATPLPGRVTCSYLMTGGEMFVNSFPSPQTHPHYQTIEQLSVDKLTDETITIMALDCEFCDTASGNALTRISIVNEQLECVYDSFVVPEEEITDYKTQYSGITPQKLAGVTTRLEDVHAELRSIITDKTVLLGHSLENDLRVMKMCVSLVIDTSFLFTPTSTPTFKPSLKFLAKKVLQKDIQTSTSGHDSVDDAKVCMELLLAKQQLGHEYTVSWNDNKRSLADYMGYCGVRSLLVDHQTQLGKHVKSKNVKCSFAIGDDNIVSSTIEGFNAKIYDFTWLQMHDFHSFCKKEYEEGNVTSSGEVRKLLASMLQLVEVLYSRASPGTMFMVCAGSGNLHEIKQFNTKRNHDMEELKTLVDKARKGVAFFKLKPHQDLT